MLRTYLTIKQGMRCSNPERRPFWGRISALLVACAGPLDRAPHASNRGPKTALAHALDGGDGETGCKRSLRAAALLGAALTATVVPAFADIYTWVDASGSLNVSNLPPPEGVEVKKILHDSPPRPAPPPNVAADANRQAEVAMLSERVAQLEQQLAAPPQYQPAPVVTYAPPPVMPPQVPVQYAYDNAGPQYSGCDGGWTDCGAPGYGYGYGYGLPYSFPYFYPASVIVVRGSPYRRYDPPGRHYPPNYGGGNGRAPGGHPSPMPMPMPMPGLNNVGMRMR
jgi:Domain of unknown function (DUF4124)